MKAIRWLACVLALATLALATVGLVGLRSAAPAVAGGSTLVVDDDDGQGSASDCNSTDVAYSTIQAAIDAAAADDTISVCPGTYDQDEANARDPDTGGDGSNDFNIFVGKAVTIQGVDASGAPITDYNNVAAHVIAKRELPTFGQSAIFVQADGVTITGLEITGWSGTENNKTVEVVGDDVTIKDCALHGMDSAAALYFDDPHFDSDTSHLQSYHIEENLIDGGGIWPSGIRFSSGAGWSGDVSGRVIKDNTFQDNMDAIAFVGPQADPWDVYPVGAATITGNSFSRSDRRHVIAWGEYNGGVGYGDLDWQGIVEDNTFDKAAITWTPEGDARAWDAAPFKNVRGIYSAIQRYAINKAQAGDTVQVLPGTYDEQVVIDTANLTLSGPNAGVDPGCSGTRPSAEATIAWSTNTTVGTASTVVIAANGATVDGFTIQNTNGNQNQVSVLIGGHYVGDTHSSDGSNVRNNIISSGYNNVYVWQSSDSTIERNRVLASVETQISIRDNAGQGTRDALRNSVLDNCIDKAGVTSLGHSVAIGVTGGGAQDFSGTLIQGNTMKNSSAGTGQYRGIDANLANGTVGNPVKIYGNTITDTSEGSIRIENSNYYDVGGSSSSTGNMITGSSGTIGGYLRGITTAGTSTGLSIQYNTISGHSSTSSNDGEIVVTTAGNTILHNTLVVADSASGGAGGIGLRADSPSNVLGENTFQGDGQRMLQVSGASGPGLTVVDATASTFKTASGVTLDPNSQADLVKIEDRVRHHMDVGSPNNYVLIIFKAKTTVATAMNNATTPGAVQRAINAVPGSTVVVGPGTYNETVRLDSTKVPNISLIGDDKTTTFITGGIRFEGNYDGLTVENFTITGDGRQRPTLAEATVGTSAGAVLVSNATFANNVFDGEGITGVGGGRFGIYISSLGGSFTFENNEVKDYRGWGTLELNDTAHTVSSYTFTGNDIHDNSGSSALRGNLSDRTDTVTVTDNVFDNNGNGSVESWASLEINEAETVTVSDNSITNTQAGFWGEGEALQFWHIASLTVTGNTIEDNYQGIYFPGGAWSSDLSGVEIHSNSISGNTQFGLQADAGNTGTADAENNYWGTLSWYGYDAVPGIKDHVSGNVDWEPWKDSSLTTSYSKPTTTYVDDNNAGKSEGQSGSSGGVFGYDAFAAIQDGINNVAASTVNVAAGTYDGFRVSSKTGLTVVGTGDPVVSGQKVLTPITTLSCSGGLDTLVAVENSTNVTIQGLTVDASGYLSDCFFGVIYYQSSGTVQENRVQNIQGTGGARGGIRADSGPSLAILDNSISEYDKAGIVSRNMDSIDIERNVITTTYHGTAPNGIDIGTYHGTNAIIKDNEISGADYDQFDAGEYEVEWSASGVVVVEAGDSLEISGNTVTNSDVGLDIESDSAIVVGNELSSNLYGIVLWNGSPIINFNTIAGNTSYGVYRTAQVPQTGTVNATYNWWGSCSGPYHPTNPLGLGDAVSDNVDFDPWITGPCDADGDGFTDDQEKLISFTNPNDPDTDHDGFFDDGVDVDGTGPGQPNDNCPAVSNPGQENADASIDNGPDIAGNDITVPNGDPTDTQGDVCETDGDIDNDWMLDTGTNPILGIPGEDVGCGSGPTNALKADTDGDTVVDGAECLLGSDPNNAGSKPLAVPPGDSDRDGLPASVEALFGSSDSNPDSDGDGIADGIEVKGWATSPSSQDTDGDSHGNDGCKDDKEIVSVNIDKLANIDDVYLVAKMAFHLLPPHAALDLNRDGVINITDVYLAAKNSTLVEPHSPC